MKALPRSLQRRLQLLLLRLKVFLLRLWLQLLLPHRRNNSYQKLSILASSHGLYHNYLVFIQGFRHRFGLTPFAVSSLHILRLLFHFRHVLFLLLMDTTDKSFTVTGSLTAWTLCSL
ncbi:hypothetical protein BDV12DRAFT_74352 [Aspergillus spectabilis]